MNLIVDRIKGEVYALYKQGVELIQKMEKHDDDISILRKTQFQYQKWYSKSLPVIQQLLPERYLEFKQQYLLENRKKIDMLTYTISDFYNSVTISKIDTVTLFFIRFQRQLYIFSSAKERIDSILSDIVGTLQAGLFDSEIITAEDLLKKGHLRAAGAVAGVILEGHLKNVLKNHNLSLKKKRPTISDFNEELKKHNLIEVLTWRLIQRLSDIRNLCVHSKGREPSKDEVLDLINGTKNISSSVC